MDGVKVADQKGRVALGSKFAGKRFIVQELEDGSATLIPVLLIPEREQPLTSGSLAKTFHDLEVMTDNWDRNDSPAPSKALITEAREAMALLHAGTLARGLRWEEPHVGVNEKGQITLEWWQDERSLTIFIRSEDQMDYLKAWGTDIESEMEDGTLHRLADFALVSRWLYADNIATVAIAPSSTSNRSQAPVEE